MKGPTGSLYTRTVHFINYHLSELLDKKAGEDDDDGHASSDVKKLVPVQDKQKMRRTIYMHMCKEKWTNEAVTIIEKSKTMSATLDDYF